MKAGVKIKYWNSNSSVDSLTGYNAFILDPYGVYAASNIKVNAGATLVFDESTKIYPQVEVSYKLLGDLAVLKAFAITRFNRNNHENTYDYNPFISELNQYGIEREMQFGAEVGGRTEKWSYELGVYYSNHEDIQEYRLDSVSQDYLYNVNLIDGNAINFRLNGSYEVTDYLDLTSAVLYRNLRDTLGENILGYYDVEWEIGARLKLLNNKFTISPRSSFLLLNPLQTSDADANFIDLQLEMNYDVTKNISIYAKGFNLLNQRNARWQGYDALGVSALGGIRVIF